MTETMGRMNWPGNTRWLWPLLLGSLALNLLAFGSMLGQKLRPQTTGLPPGIAARLAQDATAPLVKELSEAKKAQVRVIFEARRGQNRALWQTVRERRAEVAKVLEAETFDQAAYVAAMTRLIETEAKARITAQPTFAEVAAVLSPKERQDFLTTHRQLRQQLVGSQRESREGRRDRPADGTGASGGRP
jgi:uncharacterized membrane protein